MWRYSEIELIEKKKKERIIIKNIEHWDVFNQNRISMIKNILICVKCLYYFMCFIIFFSCWFFFIIKTNLTTLIYIERKYQTILITLRCLAKKVVIYISWKKDKKRKNQNVIYLFKVIFQDCAFRLG